MPIPALYNLNREGTTSWTNTAAGQRRGFGTNSARRPSGNHFSSATPATDKFRYRSQLLLMTSRNRSNLQQLPSGARCRPFAFWGFRNRTTAGVDSGQPVVSKQGGNMSDEGVNMTEPSSVLIVVPVGRNAWVRKQATLYYEGSRLVKAEGSDLMQTGTQGLSGTLYVVKDCLCRDNREVMHVERQKIVNGKVVDMKNWGEIEEATPKAA